MSHSHLAPLLLAWQSEHGRHNLPWQHPRSPYAVWISEIMLQQTQVKTVIPYFTRWMQAFPDLQTLASASEEKVLELWSGLGYYARARHLHQAAQIINLQHHGSFPQSYEAWLALPGIGASTAAAIVSQAFNQPYPILDANVKRVFSRMLALEHPVNSSTAYKILYAYANALLPADNLANYSQGLMDLGATICTSKEPHCSLCPWQDDCRAFTLGNTASFPIQLPKKKPQAKNLYPLLIHSREGLLLQKRIDTNIWQGLWSMPFITSHYHLMLQKLLTTHSLSGVALPLFKHQLSHFSLTFSSLVIALPNAQHLTLPPHWTWLPLKETQSPQLGLSVPAKKVLQLYLKTI